jgi:hypothetical protein
MGSQCGEVLQQIQHLLWVSVMLLVVQHSLYFITGPNFLPVCSDATV